MAESPPAGVATTGEPPPPHAIPHQAKKGPAEVVTLSKIRPLQLRPLNVRLVKERARTLLASTFALAFLFTLGASFAGSLTAWSSVKDWLQVVLPAETGLFGSAMGFYFGNSRDAD